MTDPRALRHIAVVGAGIAGSTVAIALARRGFDVTMVERAERLEGIGAGIQLSPNATRILARLGLLPAIRSHAVGPEAIVLVDAKSLRPLARVPLGRLAETRWGAPYLTCHRGDLQQSLLGVLARDARVRLNTGAALQALDAGTGTIAFKVSGESRVLQADCIIGADGVRSQVRRLIGRTNGRETREVAWRCTLPADAPELDGLRKLGLSRSVLAFLAPGFHLVCYPVRSGRETNLVAFTPVSGAVAEEEAKPDVGPLALALARAAPALAALARSPGWSMWPLRIVDPLPRWSDGRAVLIGDAAHAMTPFAAQGAAMAIEDADSLAEALATGGLQALAAWEQARRTRVAKVARRGAFNHFVWQARGPAALARDLALRLRSPERLAADLDWLYGPTSPADKA